MVVVILNNGKLTKVVRSADEEVISFDVARKEIKQIPVLVSADHDRAVQDIYYGLNVLASNFGTSEEKE
jgi:hypothetical protein